MDADGVGRIAVGSCGIGHDGIIADLAADGVKICQRLRGRAGESIPLDDYILVELIAPLSVFRICPVHAYGAGAGDGVVQDIDVLAGLAFSV